MGKKQYKRQCVKKICWRKTKNADEFKKQETESNNGLYISKNFRIENLSLKQVLLKNNNMKTNKQINS